MRVTTGCYSRRGILNRRRFATMLTRRAATGAGGIESGWPSQQRNLVYQGSGEGEVLREWAGMWGCLCRDGADRRPLGALRMKIVSTTSEQAIWAYNAYRFRSQKGNSG